MSAVNGQRADNRALSDDEQQLLRRLLSDPFSFPLEFKQWLVNFLESSDMILPRGSIHGLTDRRGGGAAPTEWEDVGTSGPPGGGGIQFDTYPQAGGWLYVETTDDTTSPDGYGIELRTTDDDISIFSGTGTLYLGGKFANFGFTGDAFTEAFRLRTTNGKMVFAEASGHGIEFSGYSFLVDTHFEGGGNNISLVADRILLNTVGGGNGDIQINAEKTITVSSNSVNVQLLANAGAIALQASLIQFNSFGQKGTVTTLGDVIALLQSYGLAA